MVGIAHDKLNMLASLMVVETSINDSDGYSENIGLTGNEVHKHGAWTRPCT